MLPDMLTVSCTHIITVNIMTNQATTTPAVISTAMILSLSHDISPPTFLSATPSEGIHILPSPCSEELYSKNLRGLLNIACKQICHPKVSNKITVINVENFYDHQEQNNTINFLKITFFHLDTSRYQDRGQLHSDPRNKLSRCSS